MGSGFLFAQPSFRSGVARTLDLWGLYNEFNVSPTPEVADARAMRSDWNALGTDLYGALSKVEREARRKRGER